MLHLTIRPENNLQSVNKTCPHHPKRRAFFRHKLPKRRYAKSPVNTSSGWMKGSCVTLLAYCAITSRYTAAFSGCRAQFSKQKLKADERGGPDSLGDSLPGFPTIFLSSDSSSGGGTTPLTPKPQTSSEKKRFQLKGPPSWGLMALFAQVFHSRAAHSAR